MLGNYTCIKRCLFCICQYKYEEKTYHVYVVLLTLGWPGGAHAGPAHHGPAHWGPAQEGPAQYGPGGPVRARPSTARPMRA